MAKRSRGSRRDRRRGVRPSSAAPTTRAGGAPAPSTDRAPADLTTSASSAAEPRPNTLATGAATRPSLLSAKAAEEYRYVGPDLRRIAAVVGTLLAAMLALWVAIDVMRIVTF